jgi:hypothetical protein
MLASLEKKKIKETSRLVNKKNSSRIHVGSKKKSRRLHVGSKKKISCWFEKKIHVGFHVVCKKKFMLDSILDFDRNKKSRRLHVSCKKNSCWILCWFEKKLLVGCKKNSCWIRFWISIEIKKILLVSMLDVGFVRKEKNFCGIPVGFDFGFR